MKRSDRPTTALVWLALITAIALIVPNILLDVTENYMGMWAKTLNILFPFSCYLLIMGWSRKTGWCVLATIPFMLFAAFQIALLYLYGQSIIAVDMFLNVVTTDVKEAGTLLNNLTPAIAFILFIYLPSLIWAVVSLCKKQKIDRHMKLLILGWSIPAVLISGAVLLVLSLIGKVTPGDDIFPINVIKNAAEAVNRNIKKKQYPESAAQFTYQARPSGNNRRIIALVVGETARPDRWQLFGAERATNPKLIKRSNLYTFPKALTQSNTTHKSVPMLISPLTAEDFDSLNYVKSIVTAFKEAGFETAWFTNQPPNGSYNEIMGLEADTMIIDKYAPDVTLANYAAQWLQRADTTKSQFMVLHTYGAHFPYNTRYDGIDTPFQPDSPIEAIPSNRPSMLNAYDNATFAVDLALDSLISVLDNNAPYSALIYAADHGEDIFDDERNKFLHASPTPTLYQLRVPMLMWMSDSLSSKINVETLNKNSELSLSPSTSLFHTTLEIGAVESPYFNPSLSVINPSFKEMPFLYLTDRNEAVKLEDSGVTSNELQELSSLHILK